MSSEIDLSERYVPVSFVARALSVTPRRVRVLLVQNRLSGRRCDNGYWEVLYPFNFVVGTRGPRLNAFKSKVLERKETVRPPRKWIHETEEQFAERIKTFN